MIGEPGTPPPLRATRRVFLRGLGFVYFVAFASFYSQCPGLYGQAGLEPVSAHLRQSSPSGKLPATTAEAWQHFTREPTLLWFQVPLGMTTDHALDALTVLGMAASGLAAAGLANVPSVAAMWLLYLSLTKVGQTFLSFQWDILLLEAGFAAIWAAPLLNPWTRAPPPMPAILLLRWLLFKLMLMSGVVKLMARCPTWLGLTACHYHFATQCIPTPPAWLLHQLPAVLLKLSVAATFVVELPAPFLILLPWRPVRALAASLQLLLQLLIAISGNYTYFNWLTMLLCLPLLDDTLLPAAWGGPISPSAAPCSPGSSLCSPSAKAEPPAGPDQALDATGLLFAPVEWLDQHPRVALGAALAALAAATASMFAVEVTPQGADVRLTITPEQLEAWLAQALPPAVLLWGCLLLLRGAEHALLAAAHGFSCRKGAGAEVGHRPQPTGPVSIAWGGLRASVGILWGTAVLAVTLATFVVSSINLMSLQQPLLQPFYRWPSAMELYSASQPWRISSGYGLFRRMTGVGDRGEGRLVARPEIELQGSMDLHTWVPYSFKYKPGDVNRPPPWIAPHQPRLDWQMWFAALGTYQGAPWFIHLASKLLEGEPAVLDLLGGAPREFADEPPRYVRAELYRYDMTRPGWGRPRLHPSGQGELPALGPDNASQWWVRSRVGEYLPPLDRFAATSPAPALNMRVACRHRHWAQRVCRGEGGTQGCSTLYSTVPGGVCV
mmetsp:Transcript_22202/g.61608  ORF Transcript_22202/g.61608 Transcript_22202/m.61608 type:complete len:723 (+) Transcript_22202:237-2405(+)